MNLSAQAVVSPVAVGSGGQSGWRVGTSAWLVWVAWFLVPFDLPASQALHGVLVGFLGPFYMLLLPTCVAAAAAMACVRKIVLPYPLFAWIIAGAAGVVGAVVQNAELVDLSLQDALLGYVAPAILVGISVQASQRARWFYAFLWGWAVYLVIGLVLFLVAAMDSVQAGHYWGMRPVMEQWRFWRSEMMLPGNVYATWMGNANKATNVILLLLLFAPIAAGDLRSKDRVVLVWAVFLLAIFHVVLLCSRLGLLLLPIVIWAAGYWSRLRVSIRWMIGIVLLVALVAFPEGVASGLDAVVWNESQPESGGLLGTYLSEDGRVLQWERWILSREWSLADLLCGSGSGSYGIQFYGYPEGELHNLFLDRLSAGGLLGCSAVVVAIVLALIRAVRAHPGARRRTAVVAIVILVLCGLREYAPSYLFRTSMGGVMACLALTICEAPRRGWLSDFGS